MKLPRRQFLHLAAGAAALPFAPHVARAQAYPARPVRIVAGFPPGGSNDLYARLIAQWLSEHLASNFLLRTDQALAAILALRPSQTPPLTVILYF